jgi:hypothetical protein
MRKSEKTLKYYKCAHCKKIVKRESNKKWIKSYCVETNKNVRLYETEKSKHD